MLNKVVAAKSEPMYLWSVCVCVCVCWGGGVMSRIAMKGIVVGLVFF